MTRTVWPPILVLGRDTCEDTIRSRAHLAARGIAYGYRNVEVDAEADAINRSYNEGSRVTPVILIGDPDHPARALVSRRTTTSTRPSPGSLRARSPGAGQPAAGRRRPGSEPTSGAGRPG